MVLNDTSAGSSRQWVWDRKKDMFSYKNDYGYYIPIIETLQRLLNNSEVLEEVLHPHHKSNESLGDICDGYYVKEHLVDSESIPLLHIVAYYDGVEVVNPLGSKTKKHHLSLFYFMLANINPAKRSVYQAINLLAVCKTKHLKQHGLVSILKPFISDLQTLGSPTGCSVTIGGSRLNFRGVLVAFCGDTPASNFIGGFKESVGGAYRGCRECMATKEDMYSIFTHEECDLRDEMTHLDQCSELKELTGQDFSQYSKLCGVNNLSPLHKAPFFKLTKCFPQDIMHILLEGVVPHEFTLLVAYLLEEKYLTLSELNSKIESLQYNYHDLKNKPSIIQKEAMKGTKKIGQNASQMWLLAIIFPLLCGSAVPIANPKWNLFGILLRILTISMCRIIDDRMVQKLKDLIKEHHSKFIVLYPDKMVPKFHFLVHLPDIILRFGPPRSYWCMRFEAKNKFFKQLVNGNFKNIPFTLAYEHQLWMCHQLHSSKGKNNFLYRGDEVRGESTIDFSTSDFFKDLVSHLQVQLSVPCLVLRCKYVRMNGIEYREGSVVRVCNASSSDVLPFFYVSIKSIIVFKGMKFFVCAPYTIETFDHHFNAVIVKMDCMLANLFIAFSTLFSPGVVSIYNVDSMICVIEKDHPQVFM